MSRAGAPIVASRVLAAALAGGLLLAGCGTRHGGVTLSPAAAARLPVTTAVTTASAAWAVVRTGGRRAGDTFWQLLIRPAHAARWRLVTPPGVADNAGLVLAPTAGGAMTAAFLPSAQLRFTPLATSTDDGAHWTAGLLPARLAPVPGALAALPGGRLLAVTRTGVLESGPGRKAWKSLVTLHALAGSAAGRTCGLTALTAVAAGPSGTPVIGGACGRRRSIGVFGLAKSGWQLLAPGRHAGLRGPVVVLELAAGSGGATTALVREGSGRHPRYARVIVSGPRSTDAVEPLPVRSRELTATFLDAANRLAGIAGGRLAAYATPVLGTRDNSGGFRVSARLPQAGASAGFGPDGRLTVFVPAAAGIAVWTSGKHGGWHRSQAIPVAAP
jgi:hypothetical protein